MDSTTSSIMEYEIAKLNKKVNKLENTIKKLQKENSMLASKVTNLEDVIIKLTSQFNINFQSPANFKNEFKSSLSEETWLYSIPFDKKISNDTIKKKLKIEDLEDLTFIEIKADWSNEAEMISGLLKHFENFTEFSKDFQSMNLNNLIGVFQQILEIALMSDLIIVIRNIPSNKDKKKHEIIISSIAKVAGIMYNCFEKVSGSNDTFGKMALVLESHEDLNVVNITNNDSRILLSVEKL